MEDTISLEQPKATPFRCPICLQESMKVREVEVSDLDSSSPWLRPYSVNPISSIWTFPCGHSVNRISERVAPVEEEEDEEL